MKRSIEEVEETTVGKDAGASKKPDRGWGKDAANFGEREREALTTSRKSPSDRPTFETVIPTKGLHASFSKFLTDIVLATTEPRKNSDAIDTGEPLSLEEMWFEEGTSGSETEGLSSDHEDDYVEYKFHH